LPFTKTAIDASKDNYVNSVCQVAPNKNDFHYVKVPVKYVNGHLDKFHRIDQRIDLNLSANPNTLFIEENGRRETKLQQVPD
jgi:hypothetical protein